MKTLTTSMGVLVINTICTLRCQNCITFTPYHKYPQHYSLENLVQEIRSFFQIYDSVMHFDLEGGETLLHPQIDQIVIEALKYKQSFKTLNILTNGTIIPSKLFLEACKNNPVLVIIDDYGALSSNIEKVIALLEEYQIDYRVDTYHGDNQYYGGWIDFGSLEDQKYTDDEVLEVFKNCRSGSCGAPYIKNGKMYLCPIQAVDIDHIELLEGEFIDFHNQSLENWINIAAQFSKKPINSCRYCKGFNVNGERLKAAIQLTSDLSKTNKFVNN